MDLPFHLKALPPEALDVMRFFGMLDEPVAHADYIMQEAGLSERAFGKVIRRLVTKGYVQMAGDQVYSLTDQGLSAVEELQAYDEEESDVEDRAAAAPLVRQTRRLTLALPRALPAGQPTPVYVGLSSADAAPLPAAELVVRLSVVNGEPARPQEKTLRLNGAATCETFEVTAGPYTRARIRVQVFQLGPNPDDIGVAGGMYVDTAVAAAAAASGDLTAYVTDLSVTLQRSL